MIVGVLQRTSPTSIGIYFEREKREKSPLKGWDAKVL